MRRLSIITTLALIGPLPAAGQARTAPAPTDPGTRARQATQQGSPHVPKRSRAD
ncbi:MAG: hypothetical protein K0S86_606, partial [Geminicoccaceae bacterium]|nr:hypothetical protein [Geminicoccaceae bacterium]